MRARFATFLLPPTLALAACADTPVDGDSLSASVTTATEMDGSTTGGGGVTVTGTDTDTDTGTDTGTSTGDDTGGTGASLSEGETSTGDGTTDDGTTTGGATTDDTTTDDTTGDVIPPEKTCLYKSTIYGQAPLTLDVPASSPITIEFTVPGLPAPELVNSATLYFTGNDLDHPGMEGTVFVNQNDPLDLPAKKEGNNLDLDVTMDITGLTIEGSNTIAFGASDLHSAYYHISVLAVELQAHVAECPAP